MSEMIERVARAIYESKLLQPARADDSWDGNPSVTKAFCRDAARAVMEELRNFDESDFTFTEAEAIRRFLNGDTE